MKQMLTTLCIINIMFFVTLTIIYIMSQSAKEQRDRYGDGICPECKTGYYHLVSAYQSRDKQTYYIYECDNCRHAETFTVICK